MEVPGDFVELFSQETLSNTSFGSRSRNTSENELSVLLKWALKAISLPSSWCSAHLAVYYFEYLFTAWFGDWTFWCF